MNKSRTTTWRSKTQNSATTINWRPKTRLWGGWCGCRTSTLETFFSYLNVLLTFYQPFRLIWNISDCFRRKWISWRSAAVNQSRRSRWESSEFIITLVLQQRGSDDVFSKCTAGETHPHNPSKLSQASFSYKTQTQNTDKKTTQTVYITGLLVNKLLMYV